VSRHFPSREQFHDATRHGNLIPGYREVLADGFTPVSAYAKLGRREYSFLLVCQHPTAEKLPELGGDERWQATPIGTGIDGGEEVGEVHAHHTVEHARCGRSRHVDAGHAVRP